MLIDKLREVLDADSAYRADMDEVREGTKRWADSRLKDRLDDATSAFIHTLDSYIDERIEARIQRL
jgi:hypothetical protein